MPIAEAKQDIYTRLGARPDAVVRIGMDQPPIRRIAARVAEVPGYGWLPFEPVPLSNPVTASGPGQPVALSNGLVSVEVDRTNGTFSLNGVAGYGKVIDGGDLGDSYNYSPPLKDSFVEAPSAVVARVVEPGPVRAKVEITSTYTWPDHTEGGSQARVGEHVVDVTTVVEVALVVDDLVSTDPWTPRFLRVYGTAELIERPGQFGPGAYMRITPDISWSFNLEGRPFGHDRPAGGPRRTVHRG